MQKQCGESFNSNLTGQTYNATSGLREPANLTGSITLSEANVGTTGVLPGTYTYDSDEMFRVYAGTKAGYYYENMYQDDFNEMAKSVAKNKGFYVGRFETSGFNEAKVVSKPERRDMKTNWYKMYKMQKDFGNDAVGSSMIWGCQYDQVMKFVDGKPDGTGETFSVTTPNDSRHSGSITTGTGNTPADFVVNIYDLEGNMRGWDLMAYGDKFRHGHGGSYNNINSASYISGTYPTYTNDDRRSRLVLYIKQV